MPAANKDTLIRIMTMMQLIPIYPHWTTAKRLYHALESKGFSVSKRTIERNLNDFSTVFGLVSGESPEGNKWSFSKDTPMSFLPMISAEEALSLKMAQENLSAHMPKNVQASLEGIFRKADDVLKRNQKLQRWFTKVAMSHPGLDIKTVDVEPNILDSLYAGLLNSKLVKIKYGQAKNYQKVKLLGLIVRNNKLVLPCTFEGFNDIRLILAHRVKFAELTDISYKDDFDLAAYVSSQAQGQFVSQGEIQLKLRTKEYVTVLLNESKIGKNQTISVIDNVWCEVDVKVHHTMELENFLKGYIQHIQILEPYALKDRITMQLKEGLLHQTN